MSTRRLENSENMDPVSKSVHSSRQNRFTVKLSNPNRDIQVITPSIGILIPGNTINQVLNQFEAKNLLDTAYIDELKAQLDKHEKIHGAFRHIQVRGDEHVIKALELLCNMGKNLRHASADIRKLIESEFEGSVFFNGTPIKDIPSTPIIRTKRKHLGALNANGTQGSQNSNVNKLEVAPMNGNTKIAKSTENAFKDADVVTLNEEVVSTQLSKKVCLAYNQETVIDIDVENNTPQLISDSENASLLPLCTPNCAEGQEHLTDKIQATHPNMPTKNKRSRPVKVLAGIGVGIGSLAALTIKLLNSPVGNSALIGLHDSISVATERISSTHVVPNYHWGGSQSVGTGSFIDNDTFGNRTFYWGASK